MEERRMYQENDDMLEVSDFDEDIHRREALIEEAKSIPASADWNEVMHQINDLRRRWRRIHYWDSAYEEKLAEEFDQYIDAFYAKRNEIYQSAQKLKEDLIAQAKKTALSEEWNQATEEMNALMQQWKASGSAGKEKDDALWEQFNEARQQFFDRKHAHWEELQGKFENARQVKENLIEQAAALADSQEWQKTSEKFRQLMDEWKAVGSAGREHEDALWEKFNASRQKFYEQRNAHYDELHAVQGERYEQKKKLVEKAKEIESSQSYTRENTQAMKDLGAEWKQIGSCGKEHEDQIWKEFRSVMDTYFDGLKQWNEQRHLQWRQRMQDARARKLELIQNQKRQIQRMKEDIVGLLGQRAIDDMQDRIEEKEEFIEKLEAEVADIDQTLSQQ